ncbi:MAG: hypothetical protein HKN50_06275 [Gammaproteobacteria bacterium]|nr:hypothetical protein [Gammaproteobacteria bacterium]
MNQLDFQAAIAKFSSKTCALGFVAIIGLSLFGESPLAYANANFELGDTAEAQRQLNFRVFLDDNEIGQHKVTITPEKTGKRVTVDAKFDVKILFFNAFSYRHTAEEQWQGDCLKRISTETIENGDRFFVRSKAIDSGLKIDSHRGEAKLTGCVRSFAYWDVQRLQAEKLLNSQTGRHVAANLTQTGPSSIEIDGMQVPANRYELAAEDATISLWYGADNQWLGLKTVLQGGRTLTYLRNAEEVSLKSL